MRMVQEKQAAVQHPNQKPPVVTLLQKRHFIRFWVKATAVVCFAFVASALGMWVAQNPQWIVEQIRQPYALLAGPAFFGTGLAVWLILKSFEAIACWCKRIFQSALAAYREDPVAWFFWNTIYVLLLVSVLESGQFFDLILPHVIPGLGYATAFVIDLVAINAMRARLEAVRMREAGKGWLYLIIIGVCSSASVFGNLFTALNGYHHTATGRLPDWLNDYAPYLAMLFPAMILLMSVLADHLVEKTSTRLDATAYEEREQRRLDLLKIRRQMLERMLDEESQITSLIEKQRRLKGGNLVARIGNLVARIGNLWHKDIVHERIAQEQEAIHQRIAQEQEAMYQQITQKQEAMREQIALLSTEVESSALRVQQIMQIYQQVAAQHTAFEQILTRLPQQTAAQEQKVLHRLADLEYQLTLIKENMQSMQNFAQSLERLQQKMAVLQPKITRELSPLPQEKEEAIQPEKCLSIVDDLGSENAGVLGSDLGSDLGSENADVLNTQWTEELVPLENLPSSTEKETDPAVKIVKKSSSASPKSISIEAAAARLGLTSKSVRNLRNAGRLKSPSRNKKLILLSSIKEYETSVQNHGQTSGQKSVQNHGQKSGQNHGQKSGQKKMNEQTPPSKSDDVTDITTLMEMPLSR